MALNALVFILMAADGAGIMAANGLVHLKWGSNFGPLTLSGDWWRLLSNIFIHFGIVHLAVNMYSFYFAGTYLEPILGKARYIAAYLCTGIFASLTSLWWHHEPANSAGASGAIFGLYGVFLALLSSRLIPSKTRKALLQSIGIFVLYNLVYGMKGGIDNAAHVGGLCSGFIIGYLYVSTFKSPGTGQNTITKWLTPAIALATVLIAGLYLQQHKIVYEERAALLTELENASYKDNEKFDAAYTQFIQMQDKAMQVWKDSTVTETVLNKRLKEVSLVEWNRATETAKTMQSYDVSKQAHEKAGKLLQYASLRKEEIDIFDDYVVNKTNVYRLNNVRLKIDSLIQTLQHRSQ